MSAYREAGSNREGSNDAIIPLPTFSTIFVCRYEEDVRSLQFMAVYLCSL